ncbi:hypothetical protein HY439_00165 [Candidatus Microgenomates bacterium]|nr:hypothetical protein [Candidatus Microgenomates bacterium]
MKSNYLELILKNCPRLFSATNQNKYSKNYGCLDRDFWHYKIEKDFPSSVLQTGILTLALLYKKKFPGNIYHDQKKILELTCAAADFWVKIQHADGSFSEWYPNEHSYVATAFTSYAVSEALLLLDKEFPPNYKRLVCSALERAGRWLRKNPDSEVSNHTAGAVIALYNIYLLTGKNEFRKASWENFRVLTGLQSVEGWFPEYGGADLGYLSLTVDFLAKYFQKTKEKKVLTALEKAVNFMSYFIHPDGSYGGEYGSRGTKFLIPTGLEVLSYRLSQAQDILDIWEPFDSFDDRYLIFFFLGNWIQAYLEAEKRRNGETEKLGSKKTAEKENIEFEKDFPEAGLGVRKNKNFYLVFSYKKNGVIKVFKNGKLSFSDTGWLGRLNDGRIVSSQWLNPHWQKGAVRAKFCFIREPAMGQKIIFFRLFNYTLGRIDFVAKFIERWIKRRYISSVKTAPVFLKRDLVIKMDEIILKDEISLEDGVFLKSLVKTTNFCQKYTPTSLFFTPSSLIWEKKEDLSQILNEKRTINLIKRL